MKAAAVLFQPGQSTGAKAAMEGKTFKELPLELEPKWGILVKTPVTDKRTFSHHMWTLPNQPTHMCDNPFFRGTKTAPLACKDLMA